MREIPPCYIQTVHFHLSLVIYMFVIIRFEMSPKHWQIHEAKFN